MSLGNPFQPEAPVSELDVDDELLELEVGALPRKCRICLLFLTDAARCRLAAAESDLSRSD